MFYIVFCLTSKCHAGVGFPFGINWEITTFGMSNVSPKHRVRKRIQSVISLCANPSVSVKDTTRLRLFLKADSLAPRPTVCHCLCLWSCPCLCCCCCCCVVCSSTLSPAIVHPMSRFTTVLSGVDVCVACVVCASSFLILGLPLPFPLPFLRESTCILLSPSAPVARPADTVGNAPKFRGE